MSSPGGGKNKLNTQTFKDLQTTPKILFIVAIVISILGLIGAIVGTTSIKSGGGKVAAGLIGGGVCAGTGYWAYTIFTDKKNLKTCNVSLWTKDSTYTYAAPSSDPSVKNVSECDAKKMAEYDNGETKWFLTRPNADVTSNVDVWFYTEKDISLRCPGPCTLYTCTATTTSRKIGTTTRTGCSPTAGGGGANRSPGSGTGGGSGGCALGDFTKGTGSGCDATVPNCHNGIKGSCCTDTQNGCATITNADGSTTRLTCNSKTNLITGQSISKCCIQGTIWSEIIGDCVTPANGSDCGDNSDCIKTGNNSNTCVKSSPSAIRGKCCLPGQVLDANQNCSAGTDGATCTTASNCTGGRACVNNVGGGKACCPTAGYEWYPTGGFDGATISGKCLAQNGRIQGDTCSSSSQCTSGRCGSNGRCEAPCPANTIYSTACNACVNGNIGSCCGVDIPDCNVSGSQCSKTDNPGAATGICCPSTHEKFGSICIQKTGISNGNVCRVPGNCTSGNCYNGICRPGDYCEADEECGENEAENGSRPCINNTCKACRDSNDCGSCRDCETSSNSCYNDPTC